MHEGAASRGASARTEADEIDRVLRRLERIVGCDVSVSSRLARLDDRWVHDEVVVRSGGGAATTSTAAQGKPCLGPWDPERPRTTQVNRFRRSFDPCRHPRDALQEMPRYARYCLPLEMTSDARLLVYDQSRFVCWVGLLRARGARPFGSDCLRRLNVAAPSVVSELVGIDRRRRAKEGGAPADLVFGADGSLHAACAAGRAWIDAGHRDDLAALVRRADRSGRGDEIVGGRRVHVTRMEGAGGVLYLLNLHAPRRPTMTVGARLSARQHEVAVLAASGATVEEMGAHLSVGAETVREHLKRIYARLDVATRIELARAMDHVAAS